MRSIDLGSGYYAHAGIDVMGDVGAGVVYPGETTTLFHFFFSAMMRHAVGELVLFDVGSGETRHRIDGVAGKAARLSPDGTTVVV